MSSFINENFLPLEAHIEEHAAYFHRFGALRTPTALVLDSNGEARVRIDGYPPKEEFRAYLEMALARVAFTGKQWAESGRRYGEALERYPESKVAPEALYWRGVSHYKATNDHAVLGERPGQFREKYPDSLWALKTAAWAH